MLDTMRGQWVSALVWALGGAVAMYGMALAVAHEYATIPGGADALAASITASAEAMRLLRWPAERLDTLGGYLTYHNVQIINYFLAIYGAVQGARATRGGEERHSLEEILATGTSRVAVLGQRALGFAAATTGACLVIALGTALGMAGGGEPNTVGSFVTLGTTALVAFVGYAIGAMLAQLMASSRGAAGAGAVVLTVLYLATNIGEDSPPVGWLRFVSPFHYANASRALVPGEGLDLPATVVLAVMGLALLAFAGWAFARRDYGSPLWKRREPRQPRREAATLPRAMLGSVWTSIVRRSALGLLVWALSAAVFTALLAGLQPAVMEVWSQFDFLAVIAGGPGVSAETAYWAFSGEIVSPVIVAFVVTQASGWVTELHQGRVELLLSGPVSWSRLVAGRLAATAVGVVAITAGAIAGLVVGAWFVEGTLDAAGLGRLAVQCLLLGTAVGSVAALVVAWLRTAVAVTVLAVLAGASYLLAYLVPLFGWPEWLNRLSVFWAFGHPYLEWPTASAVAILAGIAVLGCVLAMVVAERTPKTA